MDAEKKDNRGKKFHQKIKPYVVLQYLLKYADENHVESGEAIAAALDENYKLSAERRSIYRDIQEINAVALMMEQECQLAKTLEMLAKDPSDELRLVVYDPKQKGFYVRQRQYDLNDIRLLAECVYSAKFVSDGQAKRLVNALCGMVSEHQAERIKHDAFLTDRVKTNNRSVLNSIDTINQAMSRRLNGQPHKPEKVKFKYMTYSIKDMHQQVERRHGGDYIVSPFALVINDGNYYLLVYDEKKKDMRTYRLDRMKQMCGCVHLRQHRSIQPHTDIKTLQTIMGHSDIETTLDRYTHFVHENVAALAQINPYCDKQHPANSVKSRCCGLTL